MTEIAKNFILSGIEEIPIVGEVIAFIKFLEQTFITIKSIDEMRKQSPIILYLYKFSFIYGPDGIKEPCDILLKSLNNRELVSEIIKALPEYIKDITEFIANMIGLIPEVGPDIQAAILTSGDITFDSLKTIYDTIPQDFRHIFESPYGLIDKFTTIFSLALGENLTLDHYPIVEEKKSGFFSSILNKTENITKKTISIALTPEKLILKGIDKLTNIKDKLINLENSELHLLLDIQNNITSLFSLLFSLLYIESYIIDTDIKLSKLECKTNLSEKSNDTFINEKITITDTFNSSNNEHNEKRHIQEKS